MSFCRMKSFLGLFDASRANSNDYKTNTYVFAYFWALKYDKTRIVVRFINTFQILLVFYKTFRERGSFRKNVKIWKVLTRRTTILVLSYFRPQKSAKTGVFQYFPFAPTKKTVTFFDLRFKLQLSERSLKADSLLPHILTITYFRLSL